MGSPLPFSPSWPLSPRLMLMLLPLTMVDTTAVDTDTDTDTVLDTEDTMVDTTAVLMEVTTDTITAKDLLKLKLKPDTCGLVPTVTLMLSDILTDTDWADTELSMPPLPLPASNTFPPVLLPMVSLNSTKDPLMLNLRLMLMPPLMLTMDTTAVDTDTVMAVTTVMADTVLDTDMVDTAVTTVRFHG